ncbi:MAG: hypothetical protein MAG794_01394 [Gammaproteobacteria bacterium]|nr:hypothetical protein [Gammaproteobacteria bacterium]
MIQLKRTMFFPKSPRNFPGRRLLRAALRAGHILGAGVLIGAYLFEQSPSVQAYWLLFAAASGVALFATDLHATCAILFEWRGLAVLLKLGLLFAVRWMPGFEVYILTVVLAIGAVSSHLSREFRHRLWLRSTKATVDTRHG